MFHTSKLFSFSAASAVSVLALMVGAQDARAQDAEPQASEQKGNEPIVVTATRRATALTETPLSVSVVGGEALERDNIATVEDLSGRIPNLLIGNQAGGATIAIRGIGFSPQRPGDEGRVAYYIDGIYIARPSAQLGTMFDVGQLEVLRGPQGTLYGRNATGGALLVTTRDPTPEASGYLNVTLGSHDLLKTEGALSGPITDSLSARVAFQTTDRDGYGHNFVTGNDINNANTRSVRGTLLWEPGSDFRFRMTGDWHREDDNNYAIMQIREGFITPPAFVGDILFGEQDVAQSIDPVNYSDNYGVSAVASYDLSPEMTLSLTGGFRHINSYLYENTFGLPNDIARTLVGQNADQRSVDLQFTGGWDAFDLVLGVSYFNEENDAVTASAIYGLPFGAGDFLSQGLLSAATLKTNSWAFFGEGTFHVTPEFSLTAGLRYTDETKQALDEVSAVGFGAVYPGVGADPNTLLGRFGYIPQTPSAGFPRNSKTSFSPTTFKVAANWEFSPGYSVYATFVEGFKSGGFNYGTIQDPYNPERITNYEAGLRGQIGSGTTFSIAGFYMDYSSLQALLQLEGRPGTFVFNTGSATIKGFEGEFDAQISDAFHIDGNFSWLDTSFSSVVARNSNLPGGGFEDIGGNRIPQAPRYTLNIGADYTAYIGGGTLVFRGDYRRLGKTYFDIFNNAPLQQGSYGVGNASVTYTTADEHWKISAWMKNIGDQYAATAAQLGVTNLDNAVRGSIIAPRTFGVTAGYSF